MPCSMYYDGFPLFPAVYELQGLFFLLLSSGPFPGFQQFLYTHTLISEDLKGTLQVSRAPFMQLSLLWSSAYEFWLSWPPQILSSVSFQEDSWILFGFSFPALWSRKLSRLLPSAIIELTSSVCLLPEISVLCYLLFNA